LKQNDNHQGIQMNKKELIDALADKTGCTKADADRHVLALIDIITRSLEKGESITLSGFGNFKVLKRAARVGRNPRTGEAVKIMPTRVAAFKAGNKLKDILNRV